jgi:hypothetical protein
MQRKAGHQPAVCNCSGTKSACSSLLFSTRRDLVFIDAQRTMLIISAIGGIRTFASQQQQQLFTVDANYVHLWRNLKLQ